MARVQVLIDEICASVPFLTGIVSAFHQRATTVQANSVKGIGNYTFSGNMVNHAQHVASSGLYMMYGTLMTALELLEDGVIGNAICDGQVEWMLSQAHRLRQVLHIVD